MDDTTRKREMSRVGKGHTSRILSHFDYEGTKLGLDCSLLRVDRCENFRTRSVYCIRMQVQT